VLGALLGAAIALSPGAQAAQEPFCRPAPRETRMQAYQRIRGRHGFRTDEPYIRSLIRRSLVFTVDVERFPMTRRERRYVQLRDRLHLGRRATRYLLRRPELDGGTSIEDGWPGDPYILVRLTRDRAKHQRALRRLARFPRQLQTKRVPLSERDLTRIQDRIDFKAAERDGFDVVSTAPDIDRSAVTIELITARTDHLAYFRERYGRHVVTEVVATERYSPPAPSSTSTPSTERGSTSAGNRAATSGSITSRSSSTTTGSKSAWSCRPTTASTRSSPPPRTRRSSCRGRSETAC
jgi:hypothetical protein